MFVFVFLFIWWGETRTKEGRGDGVGMRIIGSVVTRRILDVLVWLTAPASASAIDKERLNCCAKSAMSVLALSSVASLLGDAVNASLSSAMVGIVATLVGPALRRASETCEGAWESSKKVDDVKERSSHIQKRIEVS